jgi:hypothetical protein
MSAARTTSVACTACTTSTPSSSSNPALPVDLSPKMDTVMALVVLLSHARARLGRLRDRALDRTASRADSHKATRCRRHNSWPMTLGIMVGTMRGGRLTKCTICSRAVLNDQRVCSYSRCLEVRAQHLTGSCCLYASKDTSDAIGIVARQALSSPMAFSW